MDYSAIFFNTHTPDLFKALALDIKAYIFSKIGYEPIEYNRFVQGGFIEQLVARYVEELSSDYHFKTHTVVCYCNADNNTAETMHNGELNILLGVVELPRPLF